MKNKKNRRRHSRKYVNFIGVLSLLIFIGAFAIMIFFGMLGEKGYGVWAWPILGLIVPLLMLLLAIFMLLSVFGDDVYYSTESKMKKIGNLQKVYIPNINEEQITNKLLENGFHKQSEDVYFLGNYISNVNYIATFNKTENIEKIMEEQICSQYDLRANQCTFCFIKLEQTTEIDVEKLEDFALECVKHETEQRKSKISRFSVITSILPVLIDEYAHNVTFFKMEKSSTFYYYNKMCKKLENAFLN